MLFASAPNRRIWDSVPTDLLSTEVVSRFQPGLDNIFAGRLLVQRLDCMCYGRIAASSVLFDFINYFKNFYDIFSYIVY